MPLQKHVPNLLDSVDLDSDNQQQQATQSLATNPT
jgi:hypothetical protein